MAKSTTTKKTTSTRGTSSKSQSSAPKKRGRPAGSKNKTTVAKKNKTDINKLWSIVMFALGLLITALSFVEGESLWSLARGTLLFGVFGASGYVIGPVLIYIGVRTITDKPVRLKIIWATCFVLLLSNFIHIFFVGDIIETGFANVFKALHTIGKENHLSGGRIAIIGCYIQRAFGAVPSKIIITILTIVFFMMLTETTPVDIIRNAKEKADREREALRKEREENEAIKEKLRAEKEKERKAKETRAIERKREALAKENEKLGKELDELIGEVKKTRKKKVDFAIDETPSKDVFADEPEQTEPENKDSVIESMNTDTEAETVIPTTETEENPVATEEFASAFDEIQAKREQSVEEAMKALAESKGFTPPEDTGVDDVLALLEGKTETKKPVYIDITDEINKTDVEPSLIKDTSAQKAVKKANSLTEQEKAEIVPVSEMQKSETEKEHKYKKLPIDLFEKGEGKNANATNNDVLVSNARILVDTLASFGVKAEITDYSRGPAVTRYELRPRAGVKVSRITGLADDIALALATSGVRIEAPIPGKSAVGIEVPNTKGSSVRIRDIFEKKEYRDSQSPLTIALGEGLSGEVVTTDLTKMPHLLIAGSTGSGKSVCINSIIVSFLYKSTPDEIQLILIDPKVVELSNYNGIPHLMMPVVTEPKKAAGALGGAVAEMEKRYRLFAENSVRDIKTFNKLVENIEKRKKGYPAFNEMTDEEKEELRSKSPELYDYMDKDLEKMPYIAIVIDELADLMMVCGKEVEDYICRIAQKARAAGIHLIVATQRPSVDVITGLIKANIPARIAFAVSSATDSRTILDGGGAEKLLGNGDMLFLPIGASKPVRVQGTWVKDKEISDVIKFLKAESEPSYNEEFIAGMEQFVPKEKGAGNSQSSSSSDGGDDRDDMFERAVEVVVEAGQASTSLLQRKLKLGYARAARIMDQMEEAGIVGQYEGSKPRQVKITHDQWLEMQISKGD